MAMRTAHRSSTGTRLYAVRDGEGRFEDIQSYKRAHAADIRRTTATEAVPAKVPKKKKKTRKLASKHK